MRFQALTLFPMTVAAPSHISSGATSVKCMTNILRAAVGEKYLTLNLCDSVRVIVLSQYWVKVESENDEPESATKACGKWKNRSHDQLTRNMNSDRIAWVLRSLHRITCRIKVTSHIASHRTHIPATSLGQLTLADAVCKDLERQDTALKSRSLVCRK